MLDQTLILDSPVNCRRYLHIWPGISQARLEVWTYILDYHSTYDFVVDFDLPASEDFIAEGNLVRVSPLLFFFGNVNKLPYAIDSFLDGNEDCDELYETVFDRNTSISTFLSRRVFDKLTFRIAFQLSKIEFLAWFATTSLYEAWVMDRGLDNLCGNHLEDMINDMLTFFDSDYPDLVKEGYYASDILPAMKHLIANDPKISDLIGILLISMSKSGSLLRTRDDVFNLLKAKGLQYIVDNNLEKLRVKVDTFLNVINGHVSVV